jgi:hypothetical protein
LTWTACGHATASVGTTWGATTEDHVDQKSIITSETVTIARPTGNAFPPALQAFSPTT